LSTTLPVALQTTYDSRRGTFAHLLRVQRTDGVVFGFTSANNSVTIGGTFYDAENGLTIGSLASSAGLAVDNMELSTINDGTIFTRAQILGGVWQNAAFVIYRYNWAIPSDGLEPLAAGTIGQVRLQDATITAELRGLQQYLQQNVGNATTRTCRARFADYPSPNANNLCRVVAAAYMEELTVSAVIDDRTFEDAGAAIPGDPDWASVTLLLHLNGADGSTALTDVSAAPYSVVAFGNAALSVVQLKFGVTSALFPATLAAGVPSYAKITPGPMNALGSGNFTVEGWVRPNARTATYPCLIGNYPSYGAGGLAIFLGHGSANVNKWQVAIGGSGFPNIQSSSSIVYDAWTHFALVRNGATISLYVGGVLEGSAAASGSYSGATATWIGASGDSLATSMLNGYVDEVRISALARYTAAFTPPATAFLGPDAVSGARPDDWFGDGVLKWTSGANVGMTMRIKTYIGSTKRFTLVFAPPSAMVNGDTLTAIAGCRKRLMDDCKTKFSNILNFQGEPHLPGIDRLTAAADVNV